MCFSLEADLVAGVALLPIAVLTLREVRHAREVPFATLPLLFALHQLVEAVVWAGTEGDVSSGLQHAAAMAYLIFAFPVLPILVPVAVLLLEPQGSRLRVAPFVALGGVVATYFAVAVFTGPIEVVVHPHALAYVAHVNDAVLWTGLYIVAVIGAPLLSGYPSLVAFGVVNFVGLTVAGLAYVEGFASLWCIWAAMSSILIMVHMYRRRHLSDEDRLRGRPRARAASSSGKAI